ATLTAIDEEAVRAASDAEAAYRRLRTRTLSPSDIDAETSFSELGRPPSWGSGGSLLGNISSSAALDRNWEPHFWGDGACS
ncbi:MAG: hypothetical protein ABEN55_14485, partial [Bradymonadaceae bacterium]